MQAILRRISHVTSSEMTSSLDIGISASDGECRLPNRAELVMQCQFSAIILCSQSVRILAFPFTRV